VSRTNPSTSLPAACACSRSLVSASLESLRFKVIARSLSILHLIVSNVLTANHRRIVAANITPNGRILPITPAGTFACERPALLIQAGCVLESPEPFSCLHVPRGCVKGLGVDEGPEP